MAAQELVLSFLAFSMLQKLYTNVKYTLSLSVLVLFLAPLETMAAEISAKPTANWWSSVSFSTLIDVGATYNPSDPKSGKNFGRLWDDKANGLTFDEWQLTAQRPIDSKSKMYDFGFKLQGIYGADARYTHYLHQFPANNNANQFDIFEATIQMHIPWFTGGGVDIKLGEYPTLGSVEANDPSTNNFYSHSYIFSFGLPSKHTGILTTVLHAGSVVVLYAGLDTGSNTTICAGDNNSAIAFLGGVGLNFWDGALTTLLSSHIGPENASAAVANHLLPDSVHVNSAMREYNDIMTVWKVNEKLTLMNDMNWVHDPALNAGRAANAFGMAQYGVYTLNDVVSLTARGEVFRDANGVFVSQYGNNADFVRSEEGLPPLSANTVSGGKTTYGALTLGLNFKPHLGGSYPSNILIRPEIRYDASLNGTTPFNDSKNRDLFTSAVDVIITF